jgi:hypothetical protein
MKIKIFTIVIFLFYGSCNSDDVFVSNIEDLSGGTYIQLIYVGSSSCPFSNNLLHEEIKKLRNNLIDWTNYNDYNFMSTGISVDLNSTQGFYFLQDSGPYDEIISGASWYNNGVSQYVWKKNSEGFTPQIIILKTDFKVVTSSLGGILKIEKEETLLESFHLLEDIKKINNNIDIFVFSWES